MKYHRQYLAAGGALLLAAFLITACGSEAAPQPNTLPATPTPTGRSPTQRRLPYLPPPVP
ncbi:MAG: hypothetical protein HC875_32290, partial [Anaerolineales bacterium]|nr:hypothetical protein [Anaerolineales bacterium]